MSVKMELLGLRELEQRLENLLEIGGKPSRALDQAGRKAWRTPLAEAQRLVPVDTGALRDGLAVTVKRSGKYLGGSVVHVSGLKIRKAGQKAERNPRRYWHIVEFGSATSSAKSYIRAAVDPKASEIATAFRDALSRSVEKAIARQEKINAESFE